MVTMTPAPPHSDRRAYPNDATLSFVYARDGWALRTFDWPTHSEVSPRGSILFQGGRGDIIEKYLESFAAWHDENWHVTAFDWRGQGGSGRLSSNPLVGHIEDFSVWIDDLARFYADWVARTPAPHVIIGHSMGGHLILRALAEDRIAPDAAVLVAPMLGFHTAPLPVWIARKAVAFMARVRPADEPAWGKNEKPGVFLPSRQLLLTHDAARYADELFWKDKIPSLTLGPPSWQWLRAANTSIAKMLVPGVIEQIKTPVLVIGTDGDKLVNPKAIVTFAARIPKAILKMFDKRVAHEILRECDAPRDEALKNIASFLAEYAPHP